MEVGSILDLCLTKRLPLLESSTEDPSINGLITFIPPGAPDQQCTCKQTW